MWDFPTSMRPVRQRLVAIALVVLAVVAGFAGGYLARGPSGSATTGTPTLAVIAAGSLAPILPGILATFADETPGVAAPIAAQLYEGSSAAAVALTLPGAPYDLFVAADFRTIPSLSEPPHASVTGWEAVFASDPLVLAYAPGAGALAGIDSTNWFVVLERPGVVLGVPNASVDPLGANAIFALELADALAHQNGSLYGHFFSNPEGALATPTANAKYVAENVAETALSTGEVNAYLLYRSYAVANHLSYVTLNSSVDLGAIDPASVAAYSSARTTVLSGSGSSVLAGAPILFALTVPSAAPQYGLGVAAAAYLLSNATAAAWAANGFAPLAPILTDRPAALPGALAGTAPDGVAPLPSYLAALLA